MRIDFRKYREEFPITKKKIYLNCASHGPLSNRVRNAIEKFFDNAQFTENHHEDESFRIIAHCRELISSIIHAEPEEIGMAPNTSLGLNIVARGLGLTSGDEILISDVEFPANVYPWLGLKENGVKVKFFKTKNGFVDLKTLRNSMTKKTKILSISFVHYFNGFRNDLEFIGKLCKERDIFFVVDGIQGVGVLELNVKNCLIDVLSCGGGKWLLSPDSTGFFYVSKEAMRKLKTVFSGWMGVDWNLDFSLLQKYSLKPFSDARKFEFGSYPYHAIRGFEKALEMIHEIGVKNIERHVINLTNILLEYLKESSYTIMSSLEQTQRSGIVLFKRKDNAHLMRKLEEENIVISMREGGIRVSPHFFNDENEIKKLIIVLTNHKFCSIY